MNFSLPYNGVLYVSLVLALTSCNYRIEKVVAGADPSGQSVPTDASQIDFAMVMDQVISQRCLECHATDQRNVSPILETYAQVKANIVDIDAAIRSGTMPKNRAPLTTEQKKLILDWIKAGAHETKQAPSETPQAPTDPVHPPPAEPPAPVPSPELPPEQIPVLLDYESVNRLVIQPSCVRCHSGPDARDGVDLTTYFDVVMNITMVKSTIISGSMPKRGTLTPDQKKLILDWIEAGAPEQAAPGVQKQSNCEEQSMTKAFVEFVTSDEQESMGRSADEKSRSADPCFPKKEIL